MLRGIDIAIACPEERCLMERCFNGNKNISNWSPRVSVPYGVGSFLCVGLYARVRTCTTIPNKLPKAMRLTPPSLDRAVLRRAISPMDSKVTVVTASQRHFRLWPEQLGSYGRPRTQAGALSQFPSDVARQVAMADEVLNHLTGSSPPPWLWPEASS